MNWLDIGERGLGLAAYQLAGSAVYPHQALKGGYFYLFGE
jgi:hypothetical protein